MFTNNAYLRYYFNKIQTPRFHFASKAGFTVKFLVCVFEDIKCRNMSIKAASFGNESDKKCYQMLYDFVSK